MKSSKNLIQTLRIVAETHSQKSVSSYNKALDSLQAFLNSGRPTAAVEDFPSERCLADWLTHMHFRGLSAKTSTLYLNLVAGLHTAAVKSGKADSTTVFKDFKAKLKKISDSDWAFPIDETSFQRFANLTKTAHRHHGEHSIALDLILASILTAADSIGKVALLKKTQEDIQNDVWREIIARHADTRRKYIFPLNQAERTPTQLERSASAMVRNLLDSRGIHTLGTPSATIEAYWIYAALRSGARGSEITSILHHTPRTWPLLRLCHPAAPDEETTRCLIERTASHFLSNPRRWYAMRLRPKTVIADLYHRFDQIRESIMIPEIFYPCDEIHRRIGGKPLLHDIVFFKTRATDITPLFSKIGDLAWCYTSGGQSGKGSYAAISEAEFTNFQRAISSFTPDYEIAPAETLNLNKGDRIIVIGGKMKGLHGHILGSRTAQPGIIYRIELFGEQQNIEWRISDTRLIKKQ